MSKKHVAVGFIALGVIATAAVGFIFFSGVLSMAWDGLPTDALPVEIAVAHVEAVTTKVAQNGTVDLINKTTVYPSTQAEIEVFNIKAGDVVVEGQIIAEYSDKALDLLEDQLKDAELALRSAELSKENVGLPASDSELLQAEVAIEEAQSEILGITSEMDQTEITITSYTRDVQTSTENYNKVMVLYEGGSATQSDLDDAYRLMLNAQTQLQTAEAKREALEMGLGTAEATLNLSQKQYDAILDRPNDIQVESQADLQQVQIDLAKRNIERIQGDIEEFEALELAPVSGTVLAAGYTEGETASIAKALCVIADINSENLVVTVYVPENDAADLALGQPADIKGGALGGSVYTGTVTKIYPVAEKRQIDNNLETVITAEITFDSVDDKIKPGYTVETEIITKVTENAVVIPLMATLLDVDNSYYVYVVNQESMVERRPVTILAYQNLFVQVEGIEDGEMVVGNPNTDLQEGTYVRRLLDEETE